MKCWHCIAGAFEINGTEKNAKKCKLIEIVKQFSDINKN